MMIVKVSADKPQQQLWPAFVAQAIGTDAMAKKSCLCGGETGQRSALV